MFLQYGLVLISIVRLGVGQICRPVAAFDIENACDFKPNLVLFLPRVNLTLTERNCNSVVDAKAFSRQPIVKYPGAALKGTYTLIMVDPDAPNHKKGKFYLHWIIVNIPGEQFIKGNLKSGNTIVAYEGPKPMEKIHSQRYMLLTFLHRMNHMRFQKITDNSQRLWFDLEEWLSSNYKLCGPTAGLQFRARLQE